MAPEALGRFAYAVLTVEFAAQLAALGLRRGLAQLLANAKKPQSCIVADAMLVAAIGSVVGMAILFAFPKAMYPDDRWSTGMDRLLRDHRAGDRLDRHRAGRARLSPRRRRDRPRALDRRAVGDQHRRLRLVLHLAR